MPSVSHRSRMNVEFSFIDGPMRGISFEGPVGQSNEASSLYSITENGTVDREFTTISDQGRQAITEMKSTDASEFGGPYEYYIYRVVDCTEDGSIVRVRVAYVDRAPFGVHYPGVLHC